MEQLSFFTPPSVAQETSEEAAKAFSKSAASMRATVLEYFEAKGKEGSTDMELYTAMASYFPKAARGTIRARRIELTDMRYPSGGQLVKSTRVKTNPSGLKAIVWRIADGTIS